MIELFAADCLEVLPLLPDSSIDLVVTSPPYNMGVDYGGAYSDSMPRAEYLKWIGHYVFGQLYRVLAPTGSFFLNMGWRPTDPWIAEDVAREARDLFQLQNKIAWVKAIALGDEPARGHDKPINSPRYLNRRWETLYHFTHRGTALLDRLAIGAPYADESNLTRSTRGKNGNVRCRGDVWFVPYETIQSGADNWHHPCPFPSLLVEYCIRLHGLTPDLVLLDPFGGVGTAGVAAKRLGVRAILIDSNPDYIAAARDRIATVVEGSGV